VRQAAGLDERDLARALGWSDGDAGLRELELGSRELDAELACTLVQRIALPRTLQTELLQQARVLPDECDVVAAEPEWHDLLQNHPEPAYLVDFGWHLFACNAATEQRYGLRAARVRAERPHVLHLLFDQSWGVRPRIANWPEVARAELAAFFLDQARLGTQHEPWYTALVQSLSYDQEFDTYWAAIQQKGRRALLVERGRAPRPVVVRLRSRETSTSEEYFQISYTWLPSDVRLRVAQYERLPT
jgi:hypothetical protein